MCALVMGLVGAGPLPAMADPSGEATPPKEGEELCTVADQRLSELSGLVADGDGYWAIPDGSDNITQLDLYRLGSDCSIEKVVTVYQTGMGAPARAADPEDLAMDKDGVLWIADFGDNTKSRQTIALWKVDPKSPKKAELYRMRYPEGIAHDGEALLLQPDGTPIVATKDSRNALLFKPTGELANNQTTDLEEAGKFAFEPTNTPGGPFGAAGQLVATGAAVSPDGKKAVLRTYTDAYEWDVPDGDVAKAISGSTAPLRTGLPNEPQGEAITYGSDGRFVTGSEAAEGEGATLYAYTPAEPPKPEETAEAEDDGGGLFSGLTLDQKILLIGGAVGTLGLILTVVGIIVIVKARKRRRLEGGDSPDDGPGDDDDDPRSRFRAPEKGYDEGPHGAVYGHQPRPETYGRGYEPDTRGRGYERDQRGGYDERVFRPEGGAPEDPYAPPAPRGGYRDDSRNRYDGGPAPRPDRGGGTVYGAGGQGDGGGRRDDYGRGDGYDPRPDFGIHGDDQRR